MTHIYIYIYNSYIYIHTPSYHLTFLWKKTILKFGVFHHVYHQLGHDFHRKHDDTLYGIRWVHCVSPCIEKGPILSVVWSVSGVKSLSCGNSDWPLVWCLMNIPIGIHKDWLYKNLAPGPLPLDRFSIRIADHSVRPAKVAWECS
jgi:hypothetical protein